MGFFPPQSSWGLPTGQDVIEWPKPPNIRVGYAPAMGVGGILRAIIAMGASSALLAYLRSVSGGQMDSLEDLREVIREWLRFAPPKPVTKPDGRRFRERDIAERIAREVTQRRYTTRGRTYRDFEKDPRGGHRKPWAAPMPQPYSQRRRGDYSPRPTETDREEDEDFTSWFERRYGRRHPARYMRRY